MRGLPWTGKSTRAKEIAGDVGKIFSTDEYWYTMVKPECPDEYNFVPRYLGTAHKWNLLRAQKEVEEEYPLIIIDNTNTTAQEAEPYISYAHPQGYKICIEEPTSPRWKEIKKLLVDKRVNKKDLKKWALELAEGSKETHNVPVWSIERMIWRWEGEQNFHRLYQ